MWRSIVIGLAAIAALFLGAVLLLERLSAEPATTAARPPRIAEQAPPSPEAPPHEPGLAPPSAGLPAPQAAPPPAAVAPAPRPPPAANHAVDLLTSLNYVRGRILECAGVTPPEASEQGRRAGMAGQRRLPPRGKAVLALDLEPQDGQMLVREARLVSRDGPNEDLGRCAVEQLQGQVLEATRTVPGASVKMQFVVEEPGR
jgi:hypothetical protein